MEHLLEFFDRYIRASVDMLQGICGGLSAGSCSAAESGGANVLQGLQRRLESGELPPIDVRGSP